MNEQTPSTEKQQAIINSLEVFATHEYKKASTDDIAQRQAFPKDCCSTIFKKSGHLFLYDYTKNCNRSGSDTHFDEIYIFELLSYSAEKGGSLSRNPYIMDFVMLLLSEKEKEVSTL